VLCLVHQAGIGRSLFIDNRGFWVLYGGFSLSEEPLDVIRISPSDHSVSHIETSEPLFMRHFVSNSCVLGCSHQDFYQVLDGGSNTKCQQLVNPQLFEFNPNSLAWTFNKKVDATASSDIGTLLKVFAMQSVAPNSPIPRSWFSSIWTHYAHSFSQCSKLSSLHNSPRVTGTLLIDNHFKLEHWNGTIASESGHISFGTWCWVSSFKKKKGKPIILFTLSRNFSECCSIRLCENRHLEVISTTSSSTTAVHLRTDHPVPSSRWFHVSVSIKYSAAFQCKLFVGGSPVGPWSSPSTLLSGNSRNADDGKFFENTSFLVHTPPCHPVDTNAIIFYKLIAVDSVKIDSFADWSLVCPPPWNETHAMISQIREITSVLRSASMGSSSVVLEIPGFLSGIVLTLLHGPKEASIDCALYLSEVCGSVISVANLDAAIAECNIGKSNFVSAVISRIQHLLPMCLSHASALLSVLHHMFRSNRDTRQVVFEAIRSFLVIGTIVPPLSDDICSGTCLALAVISGNFHADVPGAAVVSSSCHGLLKAKYADEVHVCHLEHDEYVLSAFSASTIVRDRLELPVEEEIYLSVCRFCHSIMTLCSGFRKSSGIDIRLEIACNTAIRALCSLNL